MLENINIDKVLFLDIETVPSVSDFNLLPEEMQEFWNRKSKYFRQADQSASDVYQRAGIYAEFGKIICISFGIVYTKENQRYLRLKSFAGDDEKLILDEFIQLLVKMNIGRDLLLCAHNGKEFDFPFIARRILINGLQLPSILDVSGKKPWETSFLDTMELWKFGDYKHYTSLNLLTHIFNLPSPKADIDGGQVADVYWIDKDLERIVNYCQNDVLAIVQLFLKFKGLDVISIDNITYAK